MASGQIFGPPAVDFYSMLSGLGNEIQNNAKLQQQQQALQNRKDAWSTFSQLDPTSPDYGKQATTIALKLGQAGDQDGANKFLTLAQTAADRAHQASRESIADQHWQYTQQHSGDMTEYQRAMLAQNSPTGRANIAQQYGIDPNSPEGKSYIITGALPDSFTGAGKPIPVDMGLAGTKLMVRGPNGYSLLDPKDLPTTGAPGPQIQGQRQPQAGNPAGTPTAVPVAQPPQAAGMPGAAAPADNSSAAPSNQQPAATPDLSVVDPQSGRRENFLKSLPPDVAAYIKGVADYNIDPRTSSTKGGKREQLMSAVANYDPAYNQNDFGARAKATKDFSTGPQGNMIRSFDVAIDHLNTLQQAAEAMQNGDTPALNSIRNVWRQQTGSDLPVTYEALKPLVSGEIAKAAIGSGNAVSDREELRQPLNAAGSPAQLIAPIKAYKMLMGGQLKGLKKQYEDTTGKKDFDSRLRDTTKQELEPDATAVNSGVTSSGFKWSVTQ